MLDYLDRNRRSRLTVPVEDASLLRLLPESINAKHEVELETANVILGSGSASRCRLALANSPPFKSILGVSSRREKTPNAPALTF
jgi:hypothetical protein